MVETAIFIWVLSFRRIHTTPQSVCTAMSNILFGVFSFFFRFVGKKLEIGFSTAVCKTCDCQLLILTSNHKLIVLQFSPLLLLVLLLFQNWNFRLFHWMNEFSPRYHTHTDTHNPEHLNSWHSLKWIKVEIDETPRCTQQTSKQTIIICIINDMFSYYRHCPYVKTALSVFWIQMWTEFQFCRHFLMWYWKTRRMKNEKKKKITQM